MARNKPSTSKSKIGTLKFVKQIKINYKKNLIRYIFATFKRKRSTPRAYLSKLGDNAKNGLLVNLRSEMSPNAMRRNEDSKTIRFRNCIITAAVTDWERHGKSVAYKTKIYFKYNGIKYLPRPL